jgi:predicted transcriptional regulator of viral defense system
MPSSGDEGKPSASPPFRTDEFFLRHPVFALETFRRAGEQDGLTRTALAERVKYALERGRLKLLARGLYAVVPPGVQADRFTPDRFLVAGALAADAVLAYHSALEVLGFAHAVYRDVYCLTTQRRKALRLSDGRVRALLSPRALRGRRSEAFGVESCERLGVKIRVTGPERTLVDCFAAPRYAGGLEEVMESAAAISVLDLDALGAYLDLLDERRLFAIPGFFLERRAQQFFVPPPLLERLERGRPAPRSTSTNTSGADGSSAAGT